MVKVVFVKNPFSPARDRVIKISEAKDKPLSYYADEFVQQLPNQEAWIQIDGRKVEATYEEGGRELVKADSIIVIMPKVQKGGKGILGIVAVIALSVVSMGVGNIIAGGSFFAGGAAWTAMSYFGAAAVMFLGNSLVSRFFAPKIDYGKYPENEDPTYSWNGVQTMDGQGNGISITYGKVKSGGQSIMKFTSNDGNDQYFNWLVAAGEGEVEISNISLNSNPIENYEAVTVDVRPGTNDQDVINNFNDTIISKSMAYELSNNKWREDVLEGNTTEGIIVEMECQNGLYHANDNGSLGEAWVDVKIECALVGTEQWNAIASGTRAIKNNPLGIYPNAYSMNLNTFTVSLSQDLREYIRDDDYHKIPNPTYSKWTVLITENNRNWFKRQQYSASFYPDNAKGALNVGPFTIQKETVVAKGSGYSTTIEVYQNGRITGSKAGNVRRQFRIDHLEQGQYKVRATVTDRSADVSSSRDAVRIWWTQLSSVVYDDFCYPGVALLGIKAKATEQLSGGQPQLEFLKERAKVWVWNPSTNAYEQQAANNPAWAAYDFIHGAERLKNINTGSFEFDYKGVPKELMLYSQFKAWADNCERLKLYINIEITSLKDFWSIVNQDIAPVGRGMVVQFGTKYGCIYDHKTQPVQLFNMGNIIQGSFQLNYLSTEERADCIELTYIDADKDYDKSTLTIYADDYDNLDIPNQPVQITMNGITSYEQAYREGKYQLYCNRLLTKAISFKADVEAIGCMVGDIIQVSHDVPRWSISGRILDVLEDGSIVVPVDPEEITMDAADYGLMVRSSSDNSLATYTVKNVGGEYGEVKIVCTASIKAEAGDLFSLGKVDAVVKPFTVTGITRSKDLEYTINAIEYAEGIFDENYTIPIPDSSLVTDVEAVDVINLSAYQIGWKNKSGQQLARMYVSWQMPEDTQYDNFVVMVSKDVGKTWKVIGTTPNMSLEADVDAYTTYYVKVVTVYRFDQSEGVVVGPIEEGVDVLPPNVTNLDVEVLAGGIRRYYWDFEYPEPNDIAGFRMKYIQGSTANWNTAFTVQGGLITTQPYETNTVRQGIHTVMIKAVDNAGQESPNFASCVVNFGEPLEDNVLFKTDFSANGWSDVATNGSKLADGFIHSTPKNSHWQTPGHYYWDKATSNFWGALSYKDFYVEATITAPASGNFYVLYEIVNAANILYKVVERDNIWKQYATKFKVNAGETISLRFEAPTGTEETVLKKLVAIIDVPDREEHFENLSVPAEGIELPVVTPNYQTTAVKIDSISSNLSGTYQLDIVSRTPCKIRFWRVNNDAGWSRDPVAVVADITWQGFTKEVFTR